MSTGSTEARAALVAFLAACKDGGMDPHSLLDAAEDMFGFYEIIRAAQQRAEALERENAALLAAKDGAMLAKSHWEQRAETAEALVVELERRVTFTAQRWAIECAAVEVSALERAAKACEKTRAKSAFEWELGTACAAAIRSLKTQEPTHG